MKARRSRTERSAERRRKLAEMNLLSEQRTKQTTTRVRGCALPFIGALVVASLPLAMWLR
ncbi:MAG TPA: hypothetical protein VMO88_07510 [Acidimicrobiales bacterium]|nr:hypothetical protein [Acidimicrobiales bacterium]